MKLDISALLGGGEERLPFSCRLDAAGLTDDIVSGTAEFSGVFENHSGYLSITAKASLSLTVRCARCGKAFPLSETYALDCPVRVEGAGEDDGGNRDGCTEEKGFQGEKRQETQLRLEAPASRDDEVPQVRRGYSFTQSLQELRHLRRQRGIGS